MNDVIVLGSSGFVGSSLVNQLRKKGAKFTTGARENLANNSSGFRFDLERDFDLLGKVGTEDTVVFLSAVSSPDICNNHYARAYQINVTNTIAAIESATQAGARVIFASSDVVYGETVAKVNENSSRNPLGVYAEMKAEVEQYFDHNAAVLPVRFSYIWSSTDKFSQLVREHIVDHRVLDIFVGLSRSVISLGDVTSGLMNLCQSEWSDQWTAINFAGPDCLPREKMAENIKMRYPSFEFNLSMPDSSFWEARPKTINMQSLYLSAILGRSAKSYNPNLKV